MSISAVTAPDAPRVGATAALGDVLGRHWRIFAGMAPALMLVISNVTLLGLFKTELTNGLNSDRYRIHWIIGSFAVGFMSACMTTGVCAGRLGYASSVRLGIVLFAAGGGLCGMAESIPAIIPLRFFQAYGMGLVLNASMVFLWRRFPGRLAAVMAVYGVAVYVGAVLTPAAAGLLTHWFSWRGVFFSYFPLGGAALLAAWVWLPQDDRGGVRGEGGDIGAQECQANNEGGLDVVHLGLTLGWLVCLLVVVYMGQYWGWLNSRPCLFWLAGFVVLFSGSLAWGICRAAPLIDLRPLALPHYALAIAVKVIFTVNVHLLLGIVGAYMIDLRGYQWWQGSAVLAVVCLPMLGAVVAGQVLGGFRGRRWCPLLGMAIMTLITAFLCRLDLYTSKVWLGVLLACWGGGVGLATVPVMVAVFEHLHPAQVLATAGIFNLTRFLPTIALGGLVLALGSRSTDAELDRLRLRVTHNRPAVVLASAHMSREFRQRSGFTNSQARQVQRALTEWLGANARGYATQTVLKYLTWITGAGAGLTLLLRKMPPALRR